MVYWYSILQNIKAGCLNLHTWVQSMYNAILPASKPLPALSFIFCIVCWEPFNCSSTLVNLISFKEEIFRGNVYKSVFLPYFTYYCLVSLPNPSGSNTWDWNSSQINSQDIKDKWGLSGYCLTGTVCLTCSDGICFFLFDFDVIVKYCPVLYDVSYNLR